MNTSRKPTPKSLKLKGFAWGSHNPSSMGHLSRRRWPTRPSQVRSCAHNPSSMGHLSRPEPRAGPARGAVPTTPARWVIFRDYEIPPRQLTKLTHPHNPSSMGHLSRQFDRRPGSAMAKNPQPQLDGSSFETLSRQHWPVPTVAPTTPARWVIFRDHRRTPIRPMSSIPTTPARWVIFRDQNLVVVVHGRRGLDPQPQLDGSSFETAFVGGA